MAEWLHHFGYDDDDVPRFIAIVQRGLGDLDLHYVLRCAVAKGAIECVRALIPLLPRPLNVDYFDPTKLWDETALIVAVKRIASIDDRRIQLVRLLLELGANPNAGQGKEFHVLDFLFENGCSPSAFEAAGRLLVDYGSDPFKASQDWCATRSWQFLRTYSIGRLTAMHMRRRAVLYAMLSIQRAYPRVPLDVILFIVRHHVFSAPRHSWKAWMPNSLK